MANPSAILKERRPPPPAYEMITLYPQHQNMTSADFNNPNASTKHFPTRKDQHSRLAKQAKSNAHRLMQKEFSEMESFSFEDEFYPSYLDCNRCVEKRSVTMPSSYRRPTNKHKPPASNHVKISANIPFDRGIQRFGTSPSLDRYSAEQTVKKERLKNTDLCLSNSSLNLSTSSSSRTSFCSTRNIKDFSTHETVAHTSKNSPCNVETIKLTTFQKNGEEGPASYGATKPKRFISGTSNYSLNECNTEPTPPKKPERTIMCPDCMWFWIGLIAVGFMFILFYFFFPYF